MPDHVGDECLFGRDQRAGAGRLADAVYFNRRRRVEMAGRIDQKPVGRTVGISGKPSAPSFW
jgi:hypothetical protein